MVAKIRLSFFVGWPNYLIFTFTIQFNSMEKFLFELNIGLNNNPFSFEKIKDEVDTFVQLVDIRKDSGLYNTYEEPTAVVLAMCSKENIASMVEMMCMHFTQECIPYRPFQDDSGGVLVYNTGFTGEKYMYDRKYFIPFFKQSIV